MVQVKLDLKILAFLLIFHFTGQIKIYIILMIFACLHELGHLLVGMIMGYKPYVFEIKPIGFAISFYHSENSDDKMIGKGNIYNLKNIIVYLAGPVTNIIIATIIYFFNGNVLVREELIYVNLIIAFVNMLPIYPLDGGRIIKDFLEICLGANKTYAYMLRISWITMIMILAVSSILVLKVKNYALLSMILYIFCIQLRATFKIKENKYILS